MYGTLVVAGISGFAALAGVWLQSFVTGRASDRQHAHDAADADRREVRVAVAALLAAIDVAGAALKGAIHPPVRPGGVPGMPTSENEMDIIDDFAREAAKRLLKTINKVAVLMPEAISETAYEYASLIAVSLVTLFYGGTNEEIKLQQDGALPVQLHKLIAETYQQRRPASPVGQ